MHKIFVLLLFCRCFVANTTSDIEKHIKTIHGNEDPPRKFTIFEATDEHLVENLKRFRRDLPVNKSDVQLDTKVNNLNDTHKQLMVHWVDDVVICLARDTEGTVPNKPIEPSNVFISQDKGSSYKNINDALKLGNGSRSFLDKFYTHDTFKSMFVFMDTKNKALFVTNDYGKTFERRDLSFSPTEVYFDEVRPNIFAVLSSEQELFVTSDSGESFRKVSDFVKSVHWLKDLHFPFMSIQLVVQRFKPDGTGAILYSNVLFKEKVPRVYASNVRDIYVKDNYVFITKKNENGTLDLYVSYGLGKAHPCKFSTNLPLKNFIVVDVSENRAMVAVSHSPNTTHLYVSNSLEPNNGNYVGFILSLENVFAHFPNMTWQEGWLAKAASDEAFADVYKVKGLTGIYIATRFISPVINGSMGPHHVGSVITFDGGARWRLLEPPADDIEGQSTGCSPPACSLHTSSKFSQFYPKSQVIVSSVSSASAPGVILVTGVLGGSLKGHFGVFISVDGGVSWRQTLREPHFFNMGDHGGILTAAKQLLNKGETRHMLYSINEGKTWNETPFHEQEMRLYGLMTQPGENTTIFTMFGSLAKEHRWLLVRVNFTSVFPKGLCKEDDYKVWSPSQSQENRSYIPCVFGEQTVYQRRNPNSECLNGLDYVHVVSKQPCPCDYLDFECDVGYTREGGKIKNSHFRCIKDQSVPWPDDSKPATCKPGEFFNYTRGYRKIEGDKCEGGFESHYLPDQVPCPFKEADDFLLFAQRDIISRYNLVTRKREVLPVKNLKNVIAIDFDMANNCVYWADITLDTINRQCLSNGSKSEVLVANDLSSIEGMAFDFITNNLYFVDGIRAKIELIKTDCQHAGHMRKTILNSTVLAKPRGIAIHPMAGYLFWTDWSQEDPSIRRANLDGGNVKKLFGNETVSWPNGITVDYICNRIYWVDALRDYIGSSDLQGDGFVKILANNQFVSHPFAIAIFKDTMYWDDWKRNSIFFAPKEPLKNQQTWLKPLIQPLYNLMDLKAYGTGLLNRTNSCSKANCSGTCVSLPQNKYKCLCPENFESKDGKCFCPGTDIEAKPDFSCPSDQSTCSVKQFRCASGFCISKEWRCDREDDCGDGSDEVDCVQNHCPPGNHRCGDGKCLPDYWRCDYDVDCEDGSDELNCSKQSCTSNQFSCDNGRCISKSWRCDGENDCRDNSDERNCNPNKPDSCKSDEFACKSGRTACIPIAWVCDSQSDCGDGTDELNCDNHTCASGQVSCGKPDFKCIDQAFVCDGENDCDSGVDEADCPAEPPPVLLPRPTFQDKNGSCLENMFRCKNKKCIPDWWQCDGVNDCGDSSDEVGCKVESVTEETSSNAATVHPACPIDRFQCSDGTCILIAWICDGSPDCIHGEDEKHCNASISCKNNNFKCILDGSCIQMSKVCDGVRDCPDGTDEGWCDMPDLSAGPSCSDGLFTCNGRCMPIRLLCNGVKDCIDGSDEVNCTDASRINHSLLLDVDSRGTNSTSVRLHWWAPSGNDVEFRAALKQVGSRSLTWMSSVWMKNTTEYVFNGLKPFTTYNATVFVRVKGEDAPTPVKYITVTTKEGTPSEPRNLTVTGRNSSCVSLSWLPPAEPNGIIKSYTIMCRSGNNLILKLSPGNGNTTSYTFCVHFQKNQYQFTVEASNSWYQSKPSQPIYVTFDNDLDIKQIKNHTMEKLANGSYSIKWQYDDAADRFVFEVKTTPPYPRVPSIKTTDKEVVVEIAPGREFTGQIYPQRINPTAGPKYIDGPKYRFPIKVEGDELPTIDSLTGPNDATTTVTIGWNKPNDKRDIAWQYGVYYATSIEQLSERQQYKTKNLSAQITGLYPCELYYFRVGIVGPIGVGPLSKNVFVVRTSMLAPPKYIKVGGPPGDSKERTPQMLVSWEPCPCLISYGYLISIEELTSKEKWNTKVNETQTSYLFNVSAGGHYEVKMRYNHVDAKFSLPIRYDVPFSPPPLSLSVFPENNGSFIVFWQEVSTPYTYEVLVQEGDTLTEESAEKFLVTKPPFVYTNKSSHTYTFGVRLKSKEGLISEISPLVSKRNAAIHPENSSNMAAILVPTLLVFTCLVAVIVFLVVRHRRLQNNFSRFSSSHFDARSGAATFEDTGLEDEDAPRIDRFSDDEPLMIA